MSGGRAVRDALPGPVAALRRRIREARVTLFFVALLFAVYAFEWYVAATYGVAGYARTFVATDRLSPALVLAPFAHSLGDVGHLLWSVLFLLAFGAVAERRLPPGTYFGFVVVAAYATVGAQVAVYHLGGAGGTLGASGAVLALVTYVALSTAFRWLESETVTDLEAAVAVVGVVVLAMRVESDLGLVGPPATGSSPVGHLTGALVGVGYAVWRGRDGGDRQSSATVRS